MDFAPSRERQTAPILRAMDHPCFTLLAHPSGRLILEREPYDVYMHRIIRHAKQRGMMAKNESVLVSVTHLPIGGIGIMPGKTYACSSAIAPITAAPAIECQNTVRKIGPNACARSFGSS